MKVVATAALLALLVLAGCAEPSDLEGPSEGTENPPEPGAPIEEGVVNATPRPPLAGEAWVLSGCQVVRFSLPQERQSAAQGLPPDHRPRGDVASLVLTSLSCEALSRGNHSVAKPFAWSVATTPLEAMDDDGTLEAYVREIVASDSSTVAALAAFGFPAVHGTVELALGTGIAVDVTAEGLHYTVDAPSAAPQDIGPSDQQRLRGAMGTRLFWMDCDQQVAESAIVDTPALGILEGGAMADQLGLGGPMPGQVAGSTESWSCLLREHDSG